MVQRSKSMISKIYYWTQKYDKFQIPEISRMLYVSLNLFRDAYISKMATDLCCQLKIYNGESQKLTLKHNPKTDQIIYYM